MLTTSTLYLCNSYAWVLRVFLDPLEPAGFLAILHIHLFNARVVSTHWEPDTLTLTHFSALAAHHSCLGSF